MLFPASESAVSPAEEPEAPRGQVREQDKEISHLKEENKFPEEAGARMGALRFFRRRSLEAGKTGNDVSRSAVGSQQKAEIKLSRSWD